MTSTASKSASPIALNLQGLAVKQTEATAGARAERTALRMPFLDFLRAIASQCIVLHHLVFYGPLPERAHSAAPLLFDWLYDHARMAVQVFFVLGGFFTSRGLAKYQSLNAKRVGSVIWARYRRIGVPYLATLIVAIAANEIARGWMDHGAISARPSVPQLLAHLVLLHDVLGYEALTAGIWFLAIDFQLFLLTLGLLWIAQWWRSRSGSPHDGGAHGVLLVLMSPLAVASLFWFNRDPQFDDWAIYFVGSYFLGILLHAVIERSLSPVWPSLYVSLLIAAIIIDLRPRLIVAACTAALVYFAAKTNWLHTRPRNLLINYFGRISYSLFLIHFPVLLVVNAWSYRHLSASTTTALWALGAAYLLSCLAGIGFYHGIESRVR